MDKSEAAKSLTSPNSHIRLQAARFIAENPDSLDIQKIKEALKIENVSWITRALQNAVNTVEGQDIPQKSVNQDYQDEENIQKQSYAIAVENTTRLLLHEIEPIVGALRVSSKEEIPDYQSSRVWKELEHLERLLSAISILSKAAMSPQVAEIHVSELISAAIEELKPVEKELLSTDVKTELAGNTDLIAFGDPEMVRIIVSNGLRNAREAMANQQNRDLKILVSWGETDIDYWITILDRGVGLPIGSKGVWEIGSSTKRGHLGMGLPIAQQAADSMGGFIQLTPRKEAGVSFEFRWPKPPR